MPQDHKPDKTEPGGDKSMARAIAVIAVMLLSTIALRGHLPGVERRTEPDEVTGSNPVSLVAVIAMLAVSIAVIALAAINQTRRPPAGPASGEPRRELGGERSPLRWRPLVIAAAVLVVWAAVILMLMRWLPALDLGDPPPPDSGVDADAGGTDARPDTSPAEPTGDGANVFWALAATTFALVVASVVATARSRRRSPGPSPAPAGGPASTPGPADGADLARAAELGLAEMGDLTREPRAAIIACYLAMERELEKSPGTFPQDSDTPSEVLARAIEHRALPAGHATVLVDLFEEARFSPHVMNEGHRADAMGALQAVQRDLQGTA